MLKPDVVAYGFDFNTDVRFSARGSATFAFIVEINGKWCYFPAHWLTMSDPEFTRDVFGRDPEHSEFHREQRGKAIRPADATATKRWNNQVASDFPDVPGS